MDKEGGGFKVVCEAWYQENQENKGTGHNEAARFFEKAN
jgi:hypothetical protein